jgi:hypothetical protein
MLGNLASDVATSVAILDRLPPAERPQWLPKLARGWRVIWAWIC